LSTQASDGDNTDTMMLIHVPANGKAASVISFPRDSWVTVPGSSGERSKLNGLYAIVKQTGGENAGMNLLSKGIYAITGLQVDHFVQVDLLGFYRISVAIGGVDLCLNADQNASTDNDAFVSGYSGIDLHKGVNKAVQGTARSMRVRQPASTSSVSSARMAALWVRTVGAGRRGRTQRAVFPASPRPAGSTQRLIPADRERTWRA
jgi:LCP family protein required for cell wall assembly